MEEDGGVDYLREIEGKEGGPGPLPLSLLRFVLFALTAFIFFLSSFLR